MLGPAVQAPHGPRGGIDVEPELGGNHHLIAEGGQGFTHQFLVRVRAVDLGRIEEGDATIHGRPNQRDHFLLVLGWA
ncbi:hypothetical protein D3C86_2109320 [compost metagenome]